MICISNQLIPELRSMTFSDLMRDNLYIRHGMSIKEERERFYIITTFKCPCRCKFCLFVLNEDKILDCPDSEFSDKVKRILVAFPDTNFSVSVTGGEPLMFEGRVRTILDAIRDTTTPEMVRWIGFGTSGVTRPPTYLNNYPDFRFDIHMSRHHYTNEGQRGILVRDKIYSVSDYRHVLGSHVQIALTCNLIAGGVDSLEGLLAYMDYAKGVGVKLVTFRELNKVAGDASIYNQEYILDYIKYYDHQIVSLADIIEEVEKDGRFKFLSQDVRPFIYHERWEYDGIEVKFRRVDEQQLLNYNDSFDGIDEIVLHPDGLVTGSWDRNQKVIDL